MATIGQCYRRGVRPHEWLSRLSVGELVNLERHEIADTVRPIGVDRERRPGRVVEVDERSRDIVGRTDFVVVREEREVVDIDVVRFSGESLPNGHCVILGAHDAILTFEEGLEEQV